MPNLQRHRAADELADAFFRAVKRHCWEQQLLAGCDDMKSYLILCSVISVIGSDRNAKGHDVG